MTLPTTISQNPVYTSLVLMVVTPCINLIIRFLYMPNMVHELYCCTHVKYKRSLNGNCVCIYYLYYAISKHIYDNQTHAEMQTTCTYTQLHTVHQAGYVPVHNYIEVYGCSITCSEPVYLTNGNVKVTQPISNEAWLNFKHAYK